MSRERAGAIAIGRHRGRTYVLLVRARGTTDRIFPKGHVEAGETRIAAALRELEEEGGFTGQVIGAAGDIEYETRLETVAVHYFLVRASRRTGPGEAGRKPIWVDPRVALTLLKYKSQVRLLRDLLPVIDRIGAKARRPKAAGDLFLAEFQHLAQSLLTNEEQGERRVTFFITLVTAAAGALGFFGDKVDPAFGGPWPVLTAGALFALFLFGIQTMRRVVQRNVSSDGLKLRLDRIRRYFTGRQVRRIRPFLSYDPDEPTGRDFKPWPLMGSGGWLDTVVLVNAVLAGAIAGLVTWKLDQQSRIGITIAGFGASWLALHRAGNRLHRERWEKEARRL